MQGGMYIVNAIDKDGKIQHIDIKEHPKDVPAVADIQSVLSQL